MGFGFRRDPREPPPFRDQSTFVGLFAINGLSFINRACRNCENCVKHARRISWWELPGGYGGVVVGQNPSGCREIDPGGATGKDTLHNVQTCRNIANGRDQLLRELPVGDLPICP